MKWLRSKIRKWLGIRFNANEIDKLNQLYTDLTNIGIDAHFKSPHMILIFSQINGGQIRHIEADFQTLSELNDLARRLKEQFRPRQMFYDLPMEARERFRW